MSRDMLIREVACVNNVQDSAYLREFEGKKVANTISLFCIDLWTRRTYENYFYIKILLEISAIRLCNAKLYDY